MADGAAERAAGEGLHGALEGIDEVIDILVDVIIPVVLFLAGVFTYSWLGGAQSVKSLLTQAKVSDGIAKHIAPLVPSAIAFSVGGGFWASLGRHSNIVAKALGRFVGSYFLGMGTGYLINAAFGNIQAGVLDDLIGKAEQAATPGGS